MTTPEEAMHALAKRMSNMRDGENKETGDQAGPASRPPTHPDQHARRDTLEDHDMRTKTGVESIKVGWQGFRGQGFIAPIPSPFDGPPSWDGRCDGARPTMPLPGNPLIPGTFEPDDLLPSPEDHNPLDDNPIVIPTVWPADTEAIFIGPQEEHDHKLYDEAGKLKESQESARQMEAQVQAKHDKGGEVLGEGQDGGGLRLNAGKLRLDLLPPEWLWALADVMTQGAKKYEPRNWELGMGWGSMIGCIFRHVLKFMAGERYDGDCYDKAKGTTGCHHLAMAAWNCLALMSYDLRKIGKNDLADEVDMDLLNAVNAATAKIKKGMKNDSKN